MSAANETSRKRKRQRRKNRKPKQQSPQQGHYADPLSPIASTPMKRQHTKAAGTYMQQQSSSNNSTVVTH